MDDPGSQPKSSARLRTLLSLTVTGALLAATLIYQGYHAYLAFDPNDISHLESTAILITARQLADGPSTLYGPFSGENPLVLIHPPLYYRLAALGAWPLARWGINPLSASIIAGRILSLLGLIATCWAAAKIARVDGASAFAGLWATLLIASSHPSSAAMASRSAPTPWQSPRKPSDSGSRWWPFNGAARRRFQSQYLPA